MIKVKRLICGILCLAFVLAVPATYFAINDKSVNINNVVALTLWQIDGFEGGTGSRAAFLQSIGSGFKKQCGTYINVIALSADAARKNINNGVIPDLISFGAGTWGIESVINANYFAECWCYGSYCLISLNSDDDFTSVSAENTIVNAGKDNLAVVAAMFAGVNGAALQSSTYAYVNLINEKYKYLLGTQRDIYRLNARNVNYSVKPLLQFNDLYQLIAVCSTEVERAKVSGEFISYLMQNNEKVYKLGMLGGDVGINEKIAPLERKNYEYNLKTVISELTYNDIQNAVKTNNLNKLKTLFK